MSDKLKYSDLTGSLFTLWFQIQEPDQEQCCIFVQIRYQDRVARAKQWEEREIRGIIWWSVAFILISIRLNIFQYISGEKRMRSLLRSATKCSSTLRKAMAPRKPRRDPSLSSSPPRTRSRSRTRGCSPTPTPPRRPKYPNRWSHRSTGSSRRNTKMRYRGRGSLGLKKPKDSEKKHWSLLLATHLFNFN